MPWKKSTLTTVTIAALAGLGGAALAASASRDAGTTAAPRPATRTEVVTQTVHRVRDVRLDGHASPPVRGPSPAASPAPAQRSPAPLQTRASGSGDDGEHEYEHGDDQGGDHGDD